ncbi:MAG TPA: DoxX family protein [Baekduia sp.]|nr:DoxX family protein [Baekduia sp.]
MNIGTLALRGVVGPLFVGHGTQKLFGWFGGHGIEGTGGFFENLGLRPGKRHAIAAGTAEALGGLLLTLGAFTPLAATMLSSSMVTAIRTVHAPNGPWVADNGWEYNAVVIGALAAVVEHGPGSPSVDARLFPSWHGKGWAAASLAGAAAASFVVTSLTAEPPREEQEAAVATAAASSSSSSNGTAPSPQETPQAS